MLRTINVADQAARLDQPFSMTELAYVDDFTVNVYICMGTIAWHKHLDQDELFLVYSGAISLESEWGSVDLRPRELAVVPKGVGHRSSSRLWSVVLLFQLKFLADRRNGDRRIFALDEGQIHKISILGEAAGSPSGQPPVDLVHVEDFALRMIVGPGEWAWHRHSEHDELFLVVEGSMSLDTEEGDLALQAGDMTVIPGGMFHRFRATEWAVGLLFANQEASPLGD